MNKEEYEKKCEELFEEHGMTAELQGAFLSYVEKISFDSVVPFGMSFVLLQDLMEGLAKPINDLMEKVHDNGLEMGYGGGYSDGYDVGFVDGQN